MRANPERPRGPLSTFERILLGVLALALAGLIAYYYANPPTTTKTSEYMDASGHVFDTETDRQAQPSDAVVLAGFGFAAVLGLTALLNGRLKLTGPGGSGVEVAAVTAAAAATVDTLDSEVNRLSKELEARGESVERPAEVQEAVELWRDVKDEIFRKRNA